MSVNKEQIELLEKFVNFCKSDPAILNLPQLKFYKDWLESLGAKIPVKLDPKPDVSSTGFGNEDIRSSPNTDCTADAPTDNEPAAGADMPHEKMEESAESESEVESDIELDNEGVVEGDSGPSLDMGEVDLEITEEMMEQSGTKRQEAMDAANQGSLDDALNLYTEAIKLNPQSAALFTKRANVLIRLQKPNAAIKDCDRAIELNPDSAPAYKWRGKARRMIGNWLGAYTDLNTANKIDYDDTVTELIHQVEGNAKKILEHRRRYERAHEEHVLRQRKRRIQKAKEEYEKQKERERKSSENKGDFAGGMPGGFPGGMPGGFPGGMPGGFSGGPSGSGGMPGLNELFSDPDVMAAFQDPEVMAAFQDVSQNPANMSKYENNPKIKNVIDKLKNKFGGSGGGPASC